MNMNNIETIWGSDDSETESAPPSQSVLETLREIQQNNPQIEAIFMDDEDDPRTSTQSLYDPKSPFESDSSEDVQFVKEVKAPAPKPVKVSKKPSPTDYIKVRAMSPSQMSPNLLQNGHTIVLQDPTKNAKLTKFLVIPRDIIPVLAKNKGPLAINIPGIGPLIIPNPSEMLKPQENSLNNSAAGNILMSVNGQNPVQPPNEPPPLAFSPLTGPLITPPAVKAPPVALPPLTGPLRMPPTIETPPLVQPLTKPLRIPPLGLPPLTTPVKMPLPIKAPPVALSPLTTPLKMPLPIKASPVALTPLTMPLTPKATRVAWSPLTVPIKMYLPPKVPPVALQRLTPKPPPPPKVPMYDALRDAKFSCWIYRRNLKRDLDGFTMNDRLGFYKKEQERVRICAIKLAGAIRKLESSITESKKRLVSIRYNNSRFRLVDINLIKEAPREPPKKFLKRRTVVAKKTEKRPQPQQLSEVQRNNLKTLMSWKDHFSESRYSSTDSEDDLLVTKKVVVLRGRGRRKQKLNPKYFDDTEAVPVRSQGRGGLSLRGRGRGGRMPNTITRQVKEIKEEEPSVAPSQRGRGRGARMPNTITRQVKEEEPLVAPSLRGRGRGSRMPITITRHVREEHSLRGRGRGARMFHTITRQVKEEPPVPPPRLSVRGRPRKRGRRNRGKCSIPLLPPIIRSDSLNTVRNKTSFHEDPLVTAFKKTRFFVIDNLKQFQRELDPGKPLLVVNKDQCSDMNLTEMLKRHNIVFPLSKHSDITGSIGTPAQVNEIKFVTPDVLGRHLGGATG